MEKEKKTEVITFSCNRHMYCLIQELADAKGWSPSYFCKIVMARLVEQYCFLLYQGGGEQDV